MDDPLFVEVQSGLAAQKGNWREIAADLEGVVSYGWIAAVGRGEYKSAPTYRRLRAVADYLRSLKKKRK